MGFNNYSVAGPGTISIQNAVPAGVATAFSAVETDITNSNTAAVRVSGTYTGALSLQVTLDTSSNPVWETVGASWITPVATGTPGATIASAGVGHFLISNLAPFRRMRITALAAVTGSALVTIGNVPTR